MEPGELPLEEEPGLGQEGPGEGGRQLQEKETFLGRPRGSDWPPPRRGRLKMTSSRDVQMRCCLFGFFSLKEFVCHWEARKVHPDPRASRSSAVAQLQTLSRAFVCLQYCP